MKRKNDGIDKPRDELFVSGNSERKEKFGASLWQGDASPKWPNSATEKHIDEGPVNEVRTPRIVILHAFPSTWERERHQ